MGQYEIICQNKHAGNIQFQLIVFDAVASFNVGSVAMLKILEKNED